MALHETCSLNIMLITGIILAPAAMATPAIQDLADLKCIIDAAASSIGDPNNPNRGFGFNLLGGSGQMGTADLVNNITNTILSRLRLFLLQLHNSATQSGTASIRLLQFRH